MAVGNIKGFKVKKGNETGVAKIATEAYLDGSVTKVKLAQAVQDEVDKVKDKADANGDYDSLTAGGAKQLLSTVYVEDQVPYNFRTSGGTAGIGDRMYDEVVGGTVVWNQLLKNPNFNGVTSWNVYSSTYSSANASNHVLTQTLKGDAGVSPFQYGLVQRNVVSDKSHKYLFVGTVKPSFATSFRLELGGSMVKTTGSFSANTKQTIGFVSDVRQYNNDISIHQTLQNTDLTGETIEYSNFGLYDLTAMFGSTIADYIYSLEQGTAGAGVAWFKNLFPKPYYEYNAGELMSVKAGSHDTVGFNAFNKSTVTQGKTIDSNGNVINNDTTALSDFIDAVPSTVYYINNISARGNTSIFHNYDASKNYLGPSGSFEEDGYRRQTFSNTRYIRVVFNKDEVDTACVNISWDGERNGEYEPYEKHEYPLAELELRGIPKLDAHNQLYYDGDTYASDGTVTRRYSIVDLGTLTWTYRSDDGIFYALLPDAATVGSDATKIINMVCPRYKADSWYNQTHGGEDKTVSRYYAFQDGINIKDTAYTDKDTFKTAMSGVYLVYELKTPTTETADAFTNPQVVNDFGTEEYVDYAVEAGDRDVAIPVGHNSQYMNNLRAKLEMAPDSPDGDGDYIVRQSNGENSYVPYTADGRLTALEAKLPSPPSTNGTYKLTATVTDGEVTYTWTAG